MNRVDPALANMMVMGQTAEELEANVITMQTYLYDKMLKETTATGILERELISTADKTHKAATRLTDLNQKLKEQKIDMRHTLDEVRYISKPNAVGMANLESVDDFNTQKALIKTHISKLEIDKDNLNEVGFALRLQGKELKTKENEREMQMQMVKKIQQENRYTE